jgi:hypothetical protein
MIPLAKPIVVEMFQKMNEDEIVDIARRIGKNAVKDIALFMKGKIDVNSFLSWFESRMKTSSVELNHMIENDSHTYIIKHDLGENWSFYHKNLLELIFNEILGKSIDINISNTTVMFKFKE